MPLILPRFERTVVLTDKEGRPNIVFHRWWQEVARNLESAFNQLETVVLDIQAAQEAAEVAQAAAEVAQAAAEAAQSAIPPTGSRTITATDTISDSDYTILVDASGGSVTVHLPNASTVTHQFVIQKIDATVNPVLINPFGTQNINGAATLGLTTQYEGTTITSDGASEWYAS